MTDHVNDTANLLDIPQFSDGVDRRDFIKAALGTGFALAAMPVVAQTAIKTDTTGLTAGTVSITIDGQSVPFYRAQPAGKTNLPVILVISEIFGVHEHIADVARRFAKLGYLAIAPDLFIRQGDAVHAERDVLMRDIVGKTPDAQVLSDLDACVAWAKQNNGNIDKLGITGFCWGGRITWLYVAHNPKVKAGVAWYGQLEGAPNQYKPTNPIDFAATISVPVLGLYGGKDTGITQDAIGRMKAGLAKGHSGSTFVVYPDSGHAFHADYRPSYVEKDAKDGWTRAIAWFKEHGVS